jgi:hypothetical protein
MNRNLNGNLNRNLSGILNNKINRKWLAGILLLGIWAVPGRGVAAQTSDSSQQSSAGAEDSGKMLKDSDIELLRKDLRAKKKQIAAANLNLTAEQATRFWPIYDQYTAELTKINDQKYGLIKEFANSWGSITDAQAEDMTKRAIAVEGQVAQLRLKYVPIFNQVVPGRLVATFFQIDRRLQLMIDLQLTSQLPFVQSQ